jgi:hypothetical protein
MKYLYALMDDETWFWIAQQVAETKNTADIAPLFKTGKEVTGTRPNTLISDGPANFKTAFNKELYTNGFPRAKHESHIRLQGDHDNNKMERLNVTIRDREKTMRCLKKANTLYSMVCKSIIITLVSIKAWREIHLARNAESRLKARING